MAQPGVDLVDFPHQCSCFMYTDDMVYQKVPRENRGYTVRRHQEDLKAGSKPQCVRYDMSEVHMFSIFQRVMSDFWRRGEDFAYVDVGAQYGYTAMSSAAFIRASKRQNRTYAFDCGMASSLTPYNIRLNRLESSVTFERLAVSNMSVPCQVFYQDGHTEDTHIVPREGLEAGSYVVDGTTLDDYFRGHEERMILKIDVQGAEALVFEGAEELLEREPVVFAEFVPWVLRAYSDPVRFLDKYAPGYTLFALEGGTVRPIEPDSHEAFVGELDSGEQKWANILFLPRSLEGHGDICDAIASAGNYAGPK